MLCHPHDGTKRFLQINIKEPRRGGIPQRRVQPFANERYHKTIGILPSETQDNGAFSILGVLASWRAMHFTQRRRRRKERKEALGDSYSWRLSEPIFSRALHLHFLCESRFFLLFAPPFPLREPLFPDPADFHSLRDLCLSWQ